MIAYLPMVVEAALAVSLLGVAALLVRVDRRLRTLRAGADGALKAAVELAEAVRQAEAAVADLRAGHAEAGRALQAQIEEARAMADALRFHAQTQARLAAPAEPPARPAAEPPTRLFAQPRASGFNLWEGLE